MLSRPWIVIDLATAPIADVQAFIEEPSAPANYKDPQKIADYIVERRAKLIADAALDIDLARITAIGYMTDEMTDGPQVLTCEDEDEEAGTLSFMWPFLDGKSIVTFNGLRYDLPLLVRRAMYLDFEPPAIDLDRYRSPHVDLYERLSHHGTVDAHSLTWYAKRFGWTDLHKPLSGAQEALAALEGRWDEVRASVEHDVLAVRRLAERLCLVRPLAKAVA